MLPVVEKILPDVQKIFGKIEDQQKTRRRRTLFGRQTSKLEMQRIRLTDLERYAASLER